MNLEYDYLIIGGGIAGTAAAETIRRTDGAGKIAIVEDEPHLLYSRVFLRIRKIKLLRCYARAAT